jgi:YD repeat-containing protein
MESSTEPDAGRMLDAAPDPTTPLGVCENRIDYSSMPNDATTTVARFGYDAAGRLTRYVEVDADGNVGISLSRTFDAAGLRRRQVEYTPRIPPVHRHVTWTYDAAARPASVLMETSDTKTATFLSAYSYDGNGRVARVESSSNAVLQDVTTYRYVDGEPSFIEESYDLLGDGSVDWTLRLGIAAGKWLVSRELSMNGTLRMKETYTYGDLSKGELARRDLDTDGDGTVDSVDRFTWDAGRLVHAEYVGLAGAEVYDFEYDGQGRLVKKTWRLPGFTWVTQISYGPNGLSRVERWDVPTNTLIERWAFTYGCTPDASMEILIAPIINWQRETSTLYYELDATKFGGFPEAL